jgi:hypothetical protein
MTGRRSAVGIGLWLVIGATSAAAQTTGTPSFMAPPPPLFVSSLGLYTSYGNRGNGLAFELEYRFIPRTRRFDFGIRAGVAADTGSNGYALKLLGVDTRYSFFHETDEFPVDAALTLGLGARWDSKTDQKLIPIGVTLGRHLTPPSGGVLVTTYMHPRLYYVTGDAKDAVVFNMGVGINVLFARGFEIRFGGTAGRFGGVGLGLNLYRPFPPKAPEVSGGGGAP